MKLFAVAWWKFLFFPLFLHFLYGNLILSRGIKKVKVCVQLNESTDAAVMFPLSFPISWPCLCLLGLLVIRQQNHYLQNQKLFKKGIFQKVLIFITKTAFNFDLIFSSDVHTLLSPSWRSELVKLYETLTEQLVWYWSSKISLDSGLCLDFSTIWRETKIVQETKMICLTMFLKISLTKNQRREKRARSAPG